MVFHVSDFGGKSTLTKMGSQCSILCCRCFCSSTQTLWVYVVVFKLYLMYCAVLLLLFVFAMSYIRCLFFSESWSVSQGHRNAVAKWRCVHLKWFVIVAFCDLNIVRWRSHNLIPRCTNVQRENGLQCFAKTWGSILSYTPSAPTLLSYFLQTLLSIHFPSPWAQHYPISTFNFLHFPSSCHLLSSPVYYIFSTGPWASEFLLCERSLNEA